MRTGVKLEDEEEVGDSSPDAQENLLYNLGGVKVEQDQEVFLVLSGIFFTVGSLLLLEVDQVLEDDFADGEEVLGDEAMVFALLDHLANTVGVSLANTLQRGEAYVLEQIVSPGALRCGFRGCNFEGSLQKVVNERLDRSLTLAVVEVSHRNSELDKTDVGVKIAESSINLILLTWKLIGARQWGK